MSKSKDRPRKNKKLKKPKKSKNKRKEEKRTVNSVGFNTEFKIKVVFQSCRQPKCAQKG